MKMYSLFHLVLIFLIVPVFLSGRYLKRDYKNTIIILSLILFVLEIFKQLFLYFQGLWTIWNFPYQLCSIPMYLFILYPFINSSYFDAKEDFTAIYILLGGISAICYPEDMINRGLMLTVHSFIWHYILIFMSSVIFFHKKKKTEFVKSTFIFLFHAFLALIINVILNPYGDINMFYINPFVYNTQPVFSNIASSLGIIPANTAYILSIIFGAYLICKTENKVRK